MRYVSLFFLLLLAGCSPTKDSIYYQKHPEKLAEALQRCEVTNDEDSCQQLRAVAKKMHTLATDLQQDPQAFGQYILTMQEKLAKVELALKQDPQQEDLKKSINDQKDALAEHLAIVKWLESP